MTVLKSAEMLATAGLSSTKESTDLLTSSFNSFTSSIQTEVDNLTAATSSYVLVSQTGASSA